MPPRLMQRVICSLQGVSVDVEIYRRKRDLFCAALAEMGYQFAVPEGAFYIFPKAPGGDDLAVRAGIAGRACPGRPRSGLQHARVFPHRLLRRHSGDRAIPPRFPARHPGAAALTAARIHFQNPGSLLIFGPVQVIDFPLEFMHDSCMATKTISLELDAYERLRKARRTPSESFSSVVRRAVFPGTPCTGRGGIGNREAPAATRETPAFPGIA